MRKGSCVAPWSPREHLERFGEVGSELQFGATDRRGDSNT